MISPYAVFTRLRIWIALFLFSTLLLRFWTREGTRPFFNSSPHRIASSSTTTSSPPADLYRLQHGIGADVTPKEVATQNLCRAHGWRPFKPPRHATRPRKVYDLVMVGAEVEWLEIRLNTTYDSVDHFVLVEAPQTFTGLPKPLAVKENWERFRPWWDKIILHELRYPENFHPPRPWDREDLQRDAMLEQVFPGLIAGNGGQAAPQKGDVLIVADADEIVRPEALAVLRACSFPRRLTLRSRFHYYSFEFLHRGQEWQHPQATTWQGLRGTIKPVNLRNGDGGLQPWIWWDKEDLWNAGWHCSYCYDSIERMLSKMRATSHTGQNAPKFQDRDRMADRVRQGLDLWEREGQVYDRVENNTDVPPVLLVRREEFGYLLDRSGRSAGFKDYPP